jgi:hypothetical protein
MTLLIRTDNGSQPAVERSPDVPSLTSRWTFDSQWEMLELADGSIFLDSIYTGHRLVRSPSPTIRRVLRSLSEAPASMTDLADGLSVSGAAVRPEQVAKALGPFIRAGVITIAASDTKPEWATDDLVARFVTQLDWLTMYGRDQSEHWEFFRRLRESSVAILGLGGAGSLLALMLSAAGVGRLRIVDGDIVESSNLVRQILYFPDQAGTAGKADSLAETLRRFSPYTEVEVVPEYIGEQNVARMTADVDFVAVCADAPRFKLNRWIDAACKASRTPYLGAFAGSVGPMFVPGVSACFGCFEGRMREELGERHDMVVDALAAKRSWRYPAFVSGPVGVAHLMTTEIVLRLSGAAEPATVGGILRIGRAETVRDDFPRNPACSCAGISDESAGRPGETQTRTQTNGAS